MKQQLFSHRKSPLYRLNFINIDPAWNFICIKYAIKWSVKKGCGFCSTQNKTPEFEKIVFAIWKRLNGVNFLSHSNYENIFTVLVPDIIASLASTFKISNCLETKYTLKLKSRLYSVKTNTLNKHEHTIIFKDNT